MFLSCFGLRRLLGVDFVLFELREEGMVSDALVVCHDGVPQIMLDSELRGGQVCFLSYRASDTKQHLLIPMHSSKDIMTMGILLLEMYARSSRP